MIVQQNIKLHPKLDILDVLIAKIISLIEDEQASWVKGGELILLLKMTHLINIENKKYM